MTDTSSNPLNVPMSYKYYILPNGDFKVDWFLETPDDYEPEQVKSISFTVTSGVNGLVIHRSDWTKIYESLVDLSNNSRQLFNCNTVEYPDVRNHEEVVGVPKGEILLTLKVEFNDRPFIEHTKSTVLE